MYYSEIYIHPQELLELSERRDVLLKEGHS